MIFSYIVVGVEHTGDVLRQISVQNSLDVIANVNWRQMRGTLIQTDVIYIIKLLFKFCRRRNRCS